MGDSEYVPIIINIDNKIFVEVPKDWQIDSIHADYLLKFYPQCNSRNLVCPNITIKRDSIMVESIETDTWRKASKFRDQYLESNVSVDRFIKCTYPVTCTQIEILFEEEYRKIYHIITYYNVFGTTYELKSSTSAERQTDMDRSWQRHKELISGIRLK